MKILTVVIVFLLLAAATPFAHAEHYIVDGANPKAADSNPGTPALPLKTISAAVAKLKPGDVVTIKGGIYREHVEIKASGTAAKPITIEAAPGEAVVLNEADVVKGWQKLQDSASRPLWVKTPFPHAAAFPIGKDDLSGRTQLIVDNLQYTQVEHKEDLHPGSFYYDPTGNGSLILWMLPPRATAPKIASGAEWWSNPVNLASNDPNQHQVEVAMRDWGILANNQSYLTIRGLTVRYGSGSLGIIIGGDAKVSRYINLEDCTVEYAAGALGVGGDHFLISHCYFHDNGLHSGGGLTNSIMEDCVWDHNTVYGTDHGFSAGGIKFLWTVNTIIRRCQFINNEGPGLWFDTGNSGDIIEQNFCSYNDGSGIMMEVSPDFASNDPSSKPVIDGWALKYMGLPPATPARPNIIRNNICIGNRWDGVQGAGIILQLASDEIVVNNTLVDNAQYGIFARYHPYGDWTHRLQDDTLLNNLCVDNGGGQIYITPDPVDKPGIVARNRSDFNMFWVKQSWMNRNDASGVRNYDNDRAGYAEWGKTQNDLTYSVEESYKIFGYEQHSVQAEPFFISPATLDFGLQSCSPAIGAGEVTPYVTDDYLGRKRPVGRPPSIGALEYFPGPQPPPQMPMMGVAAGDPQP